MGSGNANVATSVCGATIAVIVCSQNYDPNNEDVTWEVADTFIWSVVEVQLAIASSEPSHVCPAPVARTQIPGSSVWNLN